MAAEPFHTPFAAKADAAAPTSVHRAWCVEAAWQAPVSGTGAAWTGELQALIRASRSAALMVAPDPAAETVSRWREAEWLDARDEQGQSWIRCASY